MKTESSLVFIHGECNESDVDPTREAYDVGSSPTPFSNEFEPLSAVEASVPNVYRRSVSSPAIWNTV